MFNPYKGVSFDSQINGVSHAHCFNDTQLGYLDDGGIQYMALSNYYPSKPWYPLSEFFTEIPEGAFGSPNAEFVRFTNVSGHVHINGIGSTFTAGDENDGSPHTTWEVCMDNILANMQYIDAGGITINHPVWSAMGESLVLEMLDYAPQVLGIEIYNHSCEVSNGTGYALDLWDSILSTGRRCWGFCVTDHGAQYASQWPWKGFNVLLCNEDEYDCLRAYRTGAFYSRLQNTPLKFTGINYLGRNVSVTCENADTITFITNTGRTEKTGNEASYRPKNDDIYVRIEATGGTDRIFSNPISVKNKNIAERIILF